MNQICIEDNNQCKSCELDVERIPVHKVGDGRLPRSSTEEEYCSEYCPDETEDMESELKALEIVSIDNNSGSLYTRGESKESVEGSEEDTEHPLCVIGLHAIGESAENGRTL